MRIALAAFLSLAACSKPSSDDWTTTGGDWGKSHHSQLTDINTSNVATLGLAWQADLGTNRVLEATPVVVDGVMYTSGVAGRAYAFDAATGKELWRFEPDIDMQINRTVCCDMANRGVAVAEGQVYVAMLDGWLHSLDTKTGKTVWKADIIENRARGDHSTGAPEVAGDVVVIGMGGAEYDVRGYVSAFDLKTGKLASRFHIVPRDPKLGPQDHPDLEPAVKTWDPNSRWDVGGGGAPWDAINYDGETGLVLIGSGNGGPYHHSKRSPKGGDQLYLASIVALDAKTGRLKWHYQETPSDDWDFTATQPMILSRMTIDGEDRPVVIHAPKNGFLYVIDRRNGKLLRANPIVRVNWTKGIDPKTGRPIPNPDEADYGTSPKIVFPATPGARNWHPASYDPESGLYYAPVQDMANLLFQTPGQKPYAAKALNNDAALIFSPDLEAALPTLPPPMQAAVRALPAFAEVKRKPFTSELRAIDPLTGKTRWAVPMQGWQDRGGVLTTSGGLLFQGNLAGQLRVFDKATGKLLKTIETGTSILAAPMTYRVNGVQYIAVMAAWGGGGFATIAQGQQLFFSTGCALCHSNQHRSITPDLRRMSPEVHRLFDDIVLKGTLVPNGMPRWNDRLTPAQSAAIHAWLIDAQAKTRADELEKKRRGVPLDAPALAILSNY